MGTEDPDSYYGNAGQRSQDLQNATAKNTDSSWIKDNDLGTGKIIANTDHMRSYAVDVSTISINALTNWGLLTSNYGEIDTKPSLHQANMGPDAQFPEGIQVTQTAGDNYNVFGQFMKDLTTGVTNIGCAARAVADSYSGTDALSSAKINDVRYAFGESQLPGTDVTRPKGLPAKVKGFTADDQSGTSGGDQHQPTEKTTENPDGSTTYSSQQDGKGKDAGHGSGVQVGDTGPTQYQEGPVQRLEDELNGKKGLALPTPYPDDYTE